MTGVFVSHASADGDFIEHFVSNVLQLGCDLKPDELFYSSGADTGVPDGADLMAYVRKQVGTANLTVALITPMYLTRPVCMAELGAAWGLVGDDKLFPLLAPGIDRKNLDGILPSLLIRYADDHDALNQLHDRVGTAVGKLSTAATWGRHLRKWEKSVQLLAKGLPIPPSTSVEEVERLKSRLAEANETVDSMEDRIAELEEQLEVVGRLKDQAAVARVKLPRDQQKRFDALVGQARRALHKLKPIVREAVRCDAAVGSPMSWPNAFEDQGARQEAQRAYDDGELIDGYAGESLVPDYDFSAAAEAKAAVEAVTIFLQDVEPELHEVFHLDYGMPLDLTKRLVWDELFGG